MKSPGVVLRRLVVDGLEIEPRRFDDVIFAKQLDVACAWDFGDFDARICRTRARHAQRRWNRRFLHRRLRSRRALRVRIGGRIIRRKAAP